MATDSEANALGFATPGPADLVRDGDDHISQNARAAVDLYISLNAKYPAAIDAATRAEAAAELAEAITGLTGEDDAVALLAETPGTALHGALSATYALKGESGGLPQFAGIKRTLEAGVASTGFQVLGDSTGNEAFEWPRLLLDDLAAVHPDYTFRELLWSDATQDFTRTTIQTGTAGERYADFDGTVTDRLAPSASLTGTIDVRAKVRAPDYSPATARTIIGALSTGKRSWMLGINTGGALQMLYSTDGTALGTMSSTAVLTTAADADVWLRCVFTPNDGAGNRVAKFYTSTDGVTWTQLGSTVTTVGAVTIYDPGATDYFRLGGTLAGSYARWVGRIYEVQIRDGENGGTVAPSLPDGYISGGTSAPVVGAPVCTLVNGSHPGADLAYLGDAARLKKMTPHYAQSLIFLSESHNESLRTGPWFLSQYDTWVNAIKARHILPIIVLTQNPQRATASASVPHSVRRGDLLAYAPGKGLGVIDTFAVFTANPAWPTEWMGDDVHPNEAGQAEWYAAIEAEFTPV